MNLCILIFLFLNILKQVDMLSDEIMEEIEQLNLDVAFKKEFVFTEEQIEALYKEHSEQDYYPHLVKEMER